MGLNRAATPGLAARLFPPGSPQAVALLRAAWPRAVGGELARRSEVVAFEAGTLRVKVPDASWRRALHRMRGDILARLRALTGPVAPSRLGFVEGSVATPPEPAAPPAAAPGPAPEALVQAAEAIADPELRARFLASAALYLSRGGPR